MQSLIKKYSNLGKANSTPNLRYLISFLPNASFSTINLTLQQEIIYLCGKGKENLKQGKIEEAINTFNDTLLRVMNSRNDTLLLVDEIYKNLGRAHCKLGRTTEALDCLIQSLNVAIKVYGKNHRFIACLYRELGSVYEKQEKYDEAIICLKRAIEICNSIDLGNHSKVAKLHLKIADLYEKLGLYDESIESLHKGLQILQWYHEETDSKIQKIYLYLAKNYEKAGNLESSRLYYEKLIQINKNFMALIPIYNNLGEVCKQQGRYSESITYYSKAIDLCQRNNYVENIMAMVTLYTNLGSLYEFLGKTDQALQNYFHALSLTSKKGHVSPSHISGLYNNIGNVYFSMGSIEEALNYYHQAITAIPEKNSNLLIKPNYNLGTTYIYKEDFPQAISFLEEASRISNIYYGKNHKESAVILNMIGYAYRKNMNITKGEGLMMESIQILEGFSKTTSELINCYYMIGTFYLETNDCNKSLEFLKRALEILTSHYGENHPHALAIYKNLSWASLRKQLYSDAIFYQTKVINCQTSLSGESDPKLGLEYGTLAALYEEAGDFKKAEEYYQVSTSILNTN